MDTFLASRGNIQNYTNPTLIAFNVTYNNGGGGVHVFGSGNITVANNSCFNNYIDPYNQAAWRGCIDDVNGYGNTFINNIAVAVPAAHATCAYYTTPYAMWNSAVLDAPVQTPYDTWSNNITDMIGTGCNGEVAILMVMPLLAPRQTRRAQTQCGSMLTILLLGQKLNSRYI